MVQKVGDPQTNQQQEEKKILLLDKFLKCKFFEKVKEHAGSEIIKLLMTVC